MRYHNYDFSSYDELGRIECSAIKKDDFISCGANHSDCLKMAPRGYLQNGEQGFLTERGFFVDRVLGLEIAKYYNQIKKKHPPLDELLSEDLLDIKEEI